MPWIEKARDQFRVGWRDENGKKRRTPAMSKGECEAWIRNHEQNIAAKDMTLIKLIRLWAEAKGETAAAAMESRSLSLLVQERGWSRPDQITIAAIELWNVSRGGAGLTRPGKGVSKTHQSLLALLRWGNSRHKIPVDPDVLSMTSIKTPRKAPVPVLTDSQVAAIRAMAMTYGDAAFAVVDYLLTYGARPITACKLQVKDLNPNGPRLTIESAKQSGGWTHLVTSLHAREWQALPRPDGPNAPLFPHYKHARPWEIRDGGAKELITWYNNTIAKKLKLPKGQRGIYQLKKYAITRMLAQGMDPATIQQFTGHLDKEVILSYNHTNEELQARALDHFKRS